ncbi:unnamed protein product [Sphenostylis stenocarpa]|uniref:GH18 domain-containing protein n=1 Tax=Sphenostylis stenocarpa TaxID=92480 RepID=A0AA86VTH8_9FABA|nr:unnamed protein product [Sphenostylis stenocarpa]
MGSLIAVTFTFTLLTLAMAKTGKIAVYWGQDKGDGTLSSTCESGNYEILLLGFLNTFGCGRTPSLDLDAHCGDHTSVPCTRLGTQIQSCQKKGVRVFLALGGPSGSYSLCSSGDAKVISNYLYGNFLSGQSGPLGSVTLNGIHFHIQTSGSFLHWEHLVQELYIIRERGNTSNHNFFHLSASPQCFIPDPYLDKAIKTGNFDYIFVHFYNNPTCQYYSSGDSSWLLDSWNAWNFYVSADTWLFLGLAAAPDAAPNGGYIPPQILVRDVLPYMHQASSYGGVVLWDRSRDVQTRYSNLIKPQVLHLTKTLSSVTATSPSLCSL